MNVNFEHQHRDYIRSIRDRIIPTIYTRHLIPEHERATYSWNIIDPEWHGPNPWCMRRVFEGLVYRLDVDGLRFNLDLIKAFELVRSVGQAFEAVPYSPEGFLTFYQEQLAPHLSDDERVFIEQRPWSLSMLRHSYGRPFTIDGRNPIDCIQEAIFTNPLLDSMDLEPWGPYWQRFMEANTGLRGMWCELNYEVTHRALQGTDVVGWIAHQVENGEIPEADGYMTLARSPHLSEAQVLDAARRHGDKWELPEWFSHWHFVARFNPNARFILDYDSLNYFVCAGPNVIAYDYNRIRAEREEMNTSILYNPRFRERVMSWENETP